MTRIKEDIIREVMTKVELDHNEAKKLVESLLKIVKDSLASVEGFTSGVECMNFC